MKRDEINEELTERVQNAFDDALYDAEVKGVRVGALVHDKYNDRVFRISRIYLHASIGTSGGYGSATLGFEGKQLRRDGTFGTHSHSVILDLDNVKLADATLA